MPSGHSARAFYLLVILTSSTHSPFLFVDIDPMGSVLAPAIALWAAGVAWSRVVLGKHYLFDVMAGALMGMAVALSPYPAVPPRGIARILLASTFTVEVSIMALTPEYRTMMRGWPFLLGIVVIFWCTFPFAR